MHRKLPSATTKTMDLRTISASMRGNRHYDGASGWTQISKPGWAANY